LTETTIAIPPPPRLPTRETGLPALASVLPMLGSVGSIALVAGLGGAGNRALLGAGAFLVSSLLVAALQNDRQRRQHARLVAEAREDYVEQLAAVRAQVRAAASTQCAAASATHPPVSALAMRVFANHAVRVAGDPSHLRLRRGSGQVSLEPRLQPPESAALRKADPALVDAVRRFVTTHATVPDQPHQVDLRATARIGLGGDVEQARAMVCEAIACHAAGDLAIVVAADQEGRPDWEWLRWLPDTEAAGHTLVVLAGGAKPALSGSSTVLDLDAPKDPGVGGDHCDYATAEAVARLVARRTPLGRASWLDLLPERDGPLQVPIGHDPAGLPVWLDLREAAEGGVGPHGLLVGATGSGKSELLRTLVLGLALGHRTEELNLVLVDFKGGATFAPLADLPHVSALITNLADDVTEVDRMSEALLGELDRRQQLLHDAGASSIAEYAGPDPLPSLVIVVDEFSELLSARPEFVDVFVAIGRLGRSLGLHLLLASQRLDEGRLRGLESHLSYRIALRTFSASESRAVLGTSDAFELPATPGAGLLRSGTGAPVRFQATPVSDLIEQSVASVGGPAARRIWLPPLVDSPWLNLSNQSPSRLYVGLVDQPRAKRHAPLELDLTGAGGHLAIVGGPRSGKSSLVTGVLVALAATTSPADRQLHLLDLGGGALPADLPHVASHAQAGDTDLIRRIVRRVHAQLEEREAGATGPQLFLVVDGWHVLATDHADLSLALQAMASRGLAHGVHLIATAHRWSDLRGSVRDLFGSRLELRLGDAYESLVDRALAAGVPPGRPGRGLTSDGAHFLAAVADPAAQAQVRELWRGQEAPRLRDLPDHLRLGDLADRPAARLGVDDDSRVVTLDAQHIVISGPSGSGRTAALRTLCAELQRVHGDDTAQILAVDARRSLLGEVAGPHLLQHLTGAAATDALRDLTSYLLKRLPGNDITATQLRERTWWTGAEVWLVIDDLDLFAGPPPWTPLLPLLPHAHEIGLHLVLAHREPTRLHDSLPAALSDLGAARIRLGPRPGRAELTCAARQRPVQIAWTDPAA
jgi:S-DNA-T family DNA segregation ATPase FtsK/SpoIIIE